MKYTLNDLHYKIDVLNDKLENNPNQYLISQYLGKYAIKSIDKKTDITISISNYLKKKEIYHILESLLNFIDEFVLDSIQFK